MQNNKRHLFLRAVAVLFIFGILVVRASSPAPREDRVYCKPCVLNEILSPTLIAFLDFQSCRRLPTLARNFLGGDFCVETPESFLLKRRWADEWVVTYLDKRNRGPANSGDEGDAGPGAGDGCNDAPSGGGARFGSV